MSNESESLYQFYCEKKKPEDFDEVKIACTSALSIIPQDLDKLMIQNWSKDNDLFTWKGDIPQPKGLPFSKYTKHVEDFITECIAIKYGRYGWKVLCFYGGNKLEITFDPQRYQYYKKLLSWVNIDTGSNVMTAQSILPESSEIDT